MEVVVTEEKKKKIFRARKTMKISDRQQLECLHSTLLSAASGVSDPSPPPSLVNGTHREDEPKAGDKEQNNASDSNSGDASPASPAPFLSLNLSPSPASSENPKAKEETPPTSPFHSLNFELRKMEGEEEEEVKEKKGSPVSSSKESVTPESKENQKKDSEVTPKTEKKEEDQTTTEDPDVDLSKNSVKASSCKDAKQDKGIKEDIKEEGVKKGSISEEKMEVDSTKKKKSLVGQTKKTSRPSSTPPSNTVVQEEKGSTSGLKRTLSEGFEKDGQPIKREGKRPKVERQELEAQLEFKFTTKAGDPHKLEKIVQQMVDERLRALELTNFDKHFQELKDRVDKLEGTNKRQNAILTLQARINRLTKKFGEANQASEYKRQQESLAAVTAAAVAAAAAAAATAAAAKPPNSPQVQRPVRTSMEIKQIAASVSSSSTLANPGLSAPVSGLAHTPTSTAMMSHAPILQLITTTSNAGSNLATGITTQSPMGTLLLKATGGGSLMAGGQPLLIQLPLSMTNGQAGTLVNLPVSSLSAAGSLGKAKTTTSTATFILKPAPAITTSPHSAPVVATVQALQAGQMSPAQISLARAVYQGGAGGITTPNAGVSVTTARMPAQSVSVAGALSSASSPATSGPAATGSTAPGPPQGTSLTSKTDNQATGSTLSKAAAPGGRPKGSVIDLTEDDDDVQVTGVKSATVTAPSPTQRPTPVISIPNSVAPRSSPQSIQSASSNPQLTVHHRPTQDSQMKPRPIATSTLTRSSSVVLPPLPAAPAPSRLPPEAERSSPPQQPQLKLVPSQTGIVLSWCVTETDRTCAAVESYHLYAFHQDNSNSSAAQQHWKKIGEVNALPLPMACTLTQFQSGSTYHFAVRAKDVHGRFGSFCEPQCTNVINSSSS
ncbi:activating transcription factor 7-interacting protein 1 isoform 3-T4 [Lycodopsis pacificus]